MKINIIHGPNLNQLGKRKKEHYGVLSLEEINCLLEKKAAQLNIQLKILQSNYEGKIIDFIQHSSQEADGLIINPGAFTHYSYAISDALEDCKIPAIEVHLSNIYSREDFRAKSVTARSCTGQIAGLGYHGYLLAIEGMYFLINGRKA
ncbi:MAG: type II 3-dehydroquinate dehydratase [Atribacterota bacterium]|nr:type II 3-dehydroquinate dehydratase [Atribacterota bacterium]